MHDGQDVARESAQKQRHIGDGASAVCSSKREEGLRLAHPISRSFELPTEDAGPRLAPVEAFIPKREKACAFMIWQSIPELGTGLLLVVLVAAGYTFAVSVAASRGNLRLLGAARSAAYGTVALVAVAVLVLAYAFVTHDFRIRYVARYSDRTMPLGFLVSALWGGQDGSLLWWLFLLSGYVGGVVWWLKGRYLALQPVIIATLMSVVMFFGILMVFSANPFATSIAASPPDGTGLNPLLQNFYMIIHPPSLYMGFVGCAVPFAFAIAALVTGRLDNEWIVAVRKWMLFAWLFLSIGNTLGMLWAYVELGWGGYWAWDPVENASFLPWLAATAYVHSTMIQERRDMLKLWNVFLICLTFFLTIFGTFLTRSGAIASVHSFAQSSIGTYFLWYMGLIIATVVGLIAWRYPLLRKQAEIESPLSREAAFVANNWALLGATLFVLVATTFPIVSEALLKETVTVGPPFYNRWMVPIGLTVFFLMGMAPLLGWRKTSNRSLIAGFRIPVAATIAMAVAHAAFGVRIGFAAFVPSDPIVSGPLGIALQKLGSATPLITSSLAAFNLTVVAQEFWRGTAARRKATEEGWLVALASLVQKARRRYGGYIVHVGITLMFIGFLGQAWGVDDEASLVPGATHRLQGYVMRYAGPRVELDPGKKMFFADLIVENTQGKELGRLSPAKFVYRKNPEQPTTEVAVMHSVREDVYVVLGSFAQDSGLATFRIHVNPLVSWIWVGVLVLIAGAMISLWPELSLAEAGAWRFARVAGSSAAALFLALAFAAMPARAYALGTSSFHRRALTPQEQMSPPRSRAPNLLPGSDNH